MRKLIFLLVLFVARFAVAQTPLVTGRVTNSNGEPVSFATVKIKGTPMSAAADVDGVFKIRASPGQVLVFTAANYASQEITVGSQTTIAVRLKLSEATLSEVVVTALGQSQNKNKVGYSTATFNTAAINKDAPVGLMDGLQGKIAGAEISNTGGPGSSTKVVLRGFGVIAGGTNQPLYVIDGVPLSDAQFQNNTNQAAAGNPFTNTQDFGNGMTDINPNDIESITVLKGTAASSIYGGLAKNGAIMITTKKGRAGKLRVEYDGGANFSRVGKLPTYQSEFGQGWGGLFVLSENGSWGPKLDGKERLWGSVVDNSQLLKPFSFIKNNVRDFFETGSELNNTLSLSGGNDITKFYFSYGNVSSDGVIPGNRDALQRNTFALRTNSTFDKFSINTSFNYINRKVDAPSTGQPGADGGGLFQSLLQIPVDVPIKDFRDYKNKFFNTDGYFSPYAENPYFTVFENGNTQASDRFFGNVNASYKFSTHFSTEFRLGGDFTNSRTKTWKQKAFPTPGSWAAGNNVEGAPRTPDVGSVSQGTDNFSIINGDLILKYNQDFGNDLTLEALGGGNYYQSKSQSELTGITNLTIPGFYNLSNTSLPPLTTDASSLRRRIGVYGQATIGYKNQLYLTGNIRNDWSSTLPINSNSLFYPGANVSWVASENFNNRTTVSYLKFHAAYGRTGSDPAPYQVNPSLAVGNITLPFGTLNTPFNGVSGFSVNPVVGNLSLKPILTDEVEAGAEVRFLRDRIGLDLTVYDKKTKGQIFAIPVAPSTGYTNVVQNLGVVTDKGVEVTLNARPIESHNLSWSFTYTFARNWNKVNSLSTGLNNTLIYGIGGGPTLFAVVGKTSSSIYAPVPQLTPDGKIVVDPNTGFPVVNGTVDKDGFTLGYFGSGDYDYTMGWTNTFTIMQNFSLGFSFDFRFGGVMYSQSANQVLFDGNGIATTYNDRRPFVIPNSVNAQTDGSGKTTYTENKTFVGPGSQALGGVGHGQTDYTYGYYYPSFNHGSGWGFNIFDKSFLKMRDLTLSYNLPHAWTSHIHSSAASVGIYARNILVWTPKANQYVDPEATNVSNDIAGTFGEYAGTPLAMSFGGILRITF
ncbi:MAG: SusC/RagA family TonB-linked outer membrane protein [Bacteroidota bacterium]|nr:SusC/RagA family TonB-linked outer membrane protein [Bacteroidota bacterium]